MRANSPRQGRISLDTFLHFFPMVLNFLFCKSKRLILGYLESPFFLFLHYFVIRVDKSVPTHLSSISDLPFISSLRPHFSLFVLTFCAVVKVKLIPKDSMNMYLTFIFRRDFGHQCIVAFHEFHVVAHRKVAFCAEFLSQVQRNALVYDHLLELIHRAAIFESCLDFLLAIVEGGGQLRQI